MYPLARRPGGFLGVEEINGVLVVAVGSRDFVNWSSAIWILRLDLYGCFGTTKMRFEMRYQFNLIFTYIERNINQASYEIDAYPATGACNHVMA